MRSPRGRTRVQIFFGRVAHIRLSWRRHGRHRRGRRVRLRRRTFGRNRCGPLKRGVVVWIIGAVFCVCVARRRRHRGRRRSGSRRIHGCSIRSLIEWQWRHSTGNGRGRRKSSRGRADCGSAIVSGGAFIHAGVASVRFQRSFVRRTRCNVRIVVPLVLRLTLAFLSRGSLSGPTVHCAVARRGHRRRQWWRRANRWRQGRTGHRCGRRTLLGGVEGCI